MTSKCDAIIRMGCVSETCYTKWQKNNDGMIWLKPRFDEMYSIRLRYSVAARGAWMNPFDMVHVSFYWTTTAAAYLFSVCKKGGQLRTDVRVKRAFRFVLLMKPTELYRNHIVLPLSCLVVLWEGNYHQTNKDDIHLLKGSPKYIQNVLDQEKKTTIVQ